MQKSVETLLGRLLTDAALRRRFMSDAAAALKQLSDEGLELTELEQAALSAINREALCDFAQTLDRRLCRASLRFDNEESRHE